ncbi:hypothetical protein QBC35DRAFT_497173 [Podospora australis]|uniref:VWFA domain-containing protein n=1 Tax=Podospora australis TaxID=1536484 RepID=A0AAN6WV20_9PEZI|nr:hypothetical protein QBC35DRAFT_497173 [Podospora australis]
MTLARPLLLGTGCVLCLISTAVSFGTINAPYLIGQHNEHEMITRVAFQCPSGQKSDGICFEPRSLDQLAGYHQEVLGLPIPGGGFNGAVGAPDALDPVPEGAEAHCDDADYLDIPGYPQTRKEANEKLQICINHLRRQFRRGIVAADQLIDERSRVRPSAVDFSFPGDCTFFFPSLQVEIFSRPKCSAIEGFGRALHGVQDFYSHSNWGDQTDTSRPISESNPPGLAMNCTAPFLDLTATGPIPEDQIPHNLTTGCFILPDGTPGSLDCAGRITHHTLCKDYGIIHLDGTISDAGPGNPRSDVAPTNFVNAVRLAIQSSQEAWATFRKALIEEYGEIRGNMMICAMVRDDPVKDCRMRTTVFALDRSAKSSKPDPERAAYRVAQLVTNELRDRLSESRFDRMEVIEFAERPKVVSPMGYPAMVKFGDLDLVGTANIGRALDLAINETIKTQPETFADRAAVVLISTGMEAEEPNKSVNYILTQLQRAKDEGIRVHYGCLSVPAIEPEPEQDGHWKPRECAPGHSVIPAVMRTGGLFSYIHTLDDVKTIYSYVDLIIERGLATTDELVPENSALYPGIAVADVLDTDHPKTWFHYRASSGENVTFTLKDRALDGQGLGGGWGCFSVTLWDKLSGRRLAAQSGCGIEPLYVKYHSLQMVELMLVAELGENHLHQHHNPINVEGTDLFRPFIGADDNRVTGGIVFTVEVDTNMPHKHTDTTSTTSSVVSAKETVGISLGASETKTAEYDTSETVEILEETETPVAGERSSSTRTATSDTTATVGLDDIRSGIKAEREQEQTGAMKGRVPPVKDEL